MSDRGSVALKNVRAAEGLVDMIQTTRDFRSDLGGGGWSILWRNEDADRWASFIRKKFGMNTKSPPKLSAATSAAAKADVAIALMNVR